MNQPVARTQYDRLSPVNPIVVELTHAVLQRAR